MIKMTKLNKLKSVKNGREYTQYTITVPKKLAEDNDLHRIAELEWLQGAKGSLILKLKK